METPFSPPWWSGNVWQVGPVVVGFLLLLAVLIGFIPSPLVQLEAHSRLLNAHIEQDKESIRLLRAICRNVARDSVSREACELR